MYNQREFLVGKDQRDYSKVSQMTKEFQPFANLWKTIRTWTEKSESWLNGAWEKLEPDDVDNTFETCNKTISQVFRFFNNKEQFAKIGEIAKTMKGKVDAFKPIVPVALALRRDGMKERHWEALTEKTGIPINAETEENFTLQSIIDRGMVKFVQECDDIGEKANKEYNIEKSLAKMKKEWEGQNFLTPEFKNTRTYIIAGFDDAAALLDEHIVTG